MANDRTDEHEVHLTLAADPGLLRVVRLTAGGLAGRLGFSFDEVEDVKIAVDELCFALVGPEGRAGTIDLVFRLGPDSIAVEGRGPAGDDGDVPRTNELSDLILAAVVDEHGLAREGDEVRFHLHKRRGR